MGKCVSSAPDDVCTPVLHGNYSASMSSMSCASRSRNEQLVIGVLRLDYDYPEQLYDIDYADSFLYRIKYKRVKGLTFELAQKGLTLPFEVERELRACLKELRAVPDMAGIISDCGFLINYQDLARKQKASDARKIPIAMSSLLLLPSITSTLEEDEQILVITANACALRPVFANLMQKYCHFDESFIQRTFVIIGGEDVDGFGDEIQRGDKIDLAKAEKGFKSLIADTIKDTRHNIGAILFECTQLGFIKNGVREKFELPVWDSLDLANFIHAGASWHVPRV